MKIQLITVGGLKQKYAQIGCELFSERLKPMCRFELIELRDTKRSTKGDVRRWKKEEAARISHALQEVSLWVALDEGGSSWSSVELSQFIERSQNQAHRTLAFVIGGPDGLDPALLQSAPQRLSLGQMTLPHELARLIFLEQLYRAHSIIANTPYHRV